MIFKGVYKFEWFNVFVENWLWFIISVLMILII